MKSQQVVANDRPATRDIAAADTSAARDFRHASARGNRRDCRRARITIAVKKRVGEAASLCQAGDISRDGMLLAKAFEGLYGELPRCWLEFNLPGSDVTISARAQVVRERRRDRFHLLAVRFATLAPSHRRLIERYVDGIA